MAVMPGGLQIHRPGHHDEQPITVRNLAMSAGGLPTAEFVAEQVFHTTVRPRLILLELLPESLSRQNPWMGVAVLRHLTWGQCLRSVGELCQGDGFKRLWSTHGIPVYYFREQLLQQIGDLLLPSSREETPVPDVTSVSATDSMLSTSPAATEFSREQLQIGLDDYARKWLRKYAIGGSVERGLHHLLRRCREEGCQVVLVAPPLSTPHRALYSVRIEAEYQSYVRSLCATYQCQFVDLRGQLPDEMFTDHHHVGNWGLPRYAELIARKVIEPAWQR
jgi:hypothetical protein